MVIDMTQNHDAFSRCTPAVNFIFFLFAIVFGVIFLHPAYLCVSVFGAVLFYLTRKGKRGVRQVLAFLPLFAIVSLLNPLLNTQGTHVLFTVFGRPYTREALYYGMAMGGMFLSVLVWFLCYNEIMTSDKFTSLFGNLIPALSLLLVMILRLVPAYQRKAEQISGARRCVGKSAAANAPLRERIASGMTILSAMTSWALESSIVTADSMRSRGYGAAKRTTFRIHRFGTRDALLLACILPLAAVVIIAAAMGATSASFTPELILAPVRGFSAAALAAYALLLLIPTLLNLWEALTWRILRSKI